MTRRRIEEVQATADAVKFTLENGLIDTSSIKNALLIMPPALSFEVALPNTEFTFYSPHKNDVDIWVSQKRNIIQSITGQFDAVFIFLKNIKEENHYLFTTAHNACKQNGQIISALSNDFGAARFHKDFSKLFPNTESQSKFHCRVFWAKNPSTIEDKDTASQWLTAFSPQKIKGTELVALPSCFSSENIDQGSNLLSEHLLGNFVGTGADFGAGYGYLSYVIANSHNPSQIDLFEVDRRSLDCAKTNLSKINSSTKFNYIWQDIRRDSNANYYDWIVSNPPFHVHGYETQFLGQAFLRAASKSLKKGGRFIFVANRHLPYEEVINKDFASSSLICEKNGYKIIEAIK